VDPFSTVPSQKTPDHDNCHVCRLQSINQFTLTTETDAFYLRTFANSGTWTICDVELFWSNVWRLPFLCLHHMTAVCLPRSIVRTDLVTMISHEWLNNFDKTYRYYSLNPTYELIRFLKSKVKVTSGRRDQILWTPYLMNYLRDLNKTYRK